MACFLAAAAEAAAVTAAAQVRAKVFEGKSP